MSVAYCLNFEIENVTFDTFVDGKSIAQCIDELDVFCDSNNLVRFDSYISQELDDFFEEETEYTPKWFSAQEGIDWVQSIISKLESADVKFNKVAVLSDLKGFLKIFLCAKETDVKWQLHLDI